MANNSGAFNVLFVCTGNICRSPLAEQVFQTLAEKAKLKIESNSAGVYAEVGEPMHKLSQQAMSESNFTPKHHSAKQLSPELTKTADLILTATIDHSNSTAQLDPSAVRKTFTIKEFARISEFLAENPQYLEGQTLDHKLKAAISYRGYAPRPESNEDIIDPWGRSYETYVDVNNQITGLSKKIVEWLGAA